MSTPALTCPKCDAPMVQGFVVDNTHGGRLVSHWAEGQPQKSFWTVVKAPRAEQIPIGTYRCSGCGYLESYAGEQFEPQ